MSFGLPSPAMLLLNRPSRSILSRFSRPPILSDKDESNQTALINRVPNKQRCRYSQSFFCLQDYL